jgi:hypothetical protein
VAKIEEIGKIIGGPNRNEFELLGRCGVFG